METFDVNNNKNNNNSNVGECDEVWLDEEDDVELDRSVNINFISLLDEIAAAARGETRSEEEQCVEVSSEVSEMDELPSVNGDVFEGEVPCEVCLEEKEEEDSDRIPTATMYCVDCSQKLCDRCSRPHKRWKGGAHVIKPLGAEVEQELIQLRGRYCGKHRDKQVELYCRDCNENICLMCSAISHRNHNSVEISEAADNFRARIDDDNRAVQSVVSAVREQSGQTKQVTVEFRTEVENAKKSVLAAGEEIISVQLTIRSARNWMNWSH